MADFFGDKHHIVVARELTKTFESIYRGEVSKVREIIESDSNFQKGEFVILVSPMHHEKNESFVNFLKGLNHYKYNFIVCGINTKWDGCFKI